jgi:hypothetical protein
MRAKNVLSAPCPKVNEGTALYIALASGIPGADAISSMGLPAEAEAPIP